MHQNDESLSSTINLKYELGGTNRAITLNSTIDVLHRNALVWDDDTKAASFIDTRNDAVLSFAKAVAHTVQTDDRRAVNRNLRVAMAMFEAMGVYRISYVQDPHRPTYRDSRNNTSVVDYIQYPNQSLFYRGGDCDDLTILFCSLVESVGVETAMLTVPGHIYTAVNLATPASQVDSLFADPGLIIIHNDECWLPIEITLVGSSFQEAWETGAREWNEAAAAGKAMIYPVGEASKRWLNIGSPTEIVVADELAEETFAELYRTRLDAHVAVQLSTLTGPLTTRLESNPDDMRTLNKLGIAYASHGLLEQAEECFSEAVDNGYKPALANLGNVHLLNGKYRQAVNDFNQVLEERPNSSVAIAGLARASSQAGERLKVEKYLAQLDDIDQGMAVQLAGLSTSGNEDRAAELSVNSFMYWAGEEE